MEYRKCEECTYRKQDELFCFPCMVQILAERRKKAYRIKEDRIYEY